jgi:hypothetical protein
LTNSERGLSAATRFAAMNSLSILERGKEELHYMRDSLARIKTNSGERIIELFAEIDSIKITVSEITSFEAGRIRAIYTNISKLERIHDKAVVKMDKLGGAHGMIFGKRKAAAAVE